MHFIMLDHIVILVSHQELLTLPDHLHSLTISTGGRHADGLTWNRLILFEDGVYIELIAFYDDIDPERRQSHRWGNLPEGTIIDWACSLRKSSDFSVIRQRVVDANAGFSYTQPAPGGRTKPDGTELKWAIGAPLDRYGNVTHPGVLPFWCLDETPRRLRVPYEESPEATTHPSRAKGVSRLVITVPDKDFENLVKVYSAFLGGGPKWHFDVPSGAYARQSIALERGDTVQVKLALAGTEASPSFIEILPGLVVKIDRE